MQQPVVHFLAEDCVLFTFGTGMSDTAWQQVVNLQQQLEHQPFPGFREAVPSYNSIAVFFHAPQTRLTIVSTIKKQVDFTATNQPVAPGTHHQLPVYYSPETGDDLLSTAQQLNLSPQQLVQQHSSQLYRVYVTGFLPGFPYMGILPTELFTKRKEQPRLAVPAGSVAIAGEQTGIYPFESPGGWNLIGRTPVRLFQPEADQPFLLKAGDTVCFQPITKKEFETTFAQQAPPQLLPEPEGEDILELLQCGFLTTLQDQGRNGYRQYGVPKAGCMDPLSAQLANRLVGNDPGAPVLELTQSPHRFLIKKDTLAAFSGGGLQPEACGSELPLNQALLLKAGSVVECRKLLPGYRLYMSVGGGFSAHSFLNSCATDLRMQVGGLQGRSLKKGDRLLQQQDLSFLQQQLKGILEQSTLSLNVPALPLSAHTIRVVEGPEWQKIDETSQHSFWEQQFTISPQSNRMGYRINSQQPVRYTGSELISSPVTEGTIQLTPSGECIILMADGQTIGGYPRIAQVIKADLPLLAQKKPGDQIRLECISLQVAVLLLEEQEAALQKLTDQIKALYEGGSEL